MEIRRFTVPEAIKIYSTRAQEDFPPLELKPVHRVEKMLSDGGYRGYGLYEENELRAYTFFLCLENSPYALWDYMAVAPGERGKGYGSYFFAHIKDVAPELDGMIFEVEDPAAAKDDEDLRVRNRRIALFERLGAVHTRVRACVYTVDYLVMYWKLRAPHDDALVAKTLDRVYAATLEDFVYPEHTAVTLDRA